MVTIEEIGTSNAMGRIMGHGRVPLGFALPVKAFPLRDIP